MRCANPDCNQLANDLTTGALRLLELDMPPELRVIRSDGGFPVCTVPSRYFWLCEHCSKFLSIRRWTKEGLTLEFKMKGHSDRRHVEEIRLPVASVRPSLRPVIGRLA